MVVEGDVALRVHIGDVAIIIGSMTDVAAAAVAGNVFHDIGVGGVELIRRLYSDRRGLNVHRHLTKRHHGKVDFITC